MTEVTRVPLQPIAKGSLTKLWIGVIVAIAIAAGLAWYATPKGIEVEQLVAGSGDRPSMGEVVFVNYVGKLPGGEEFDRSPPSPFPPGIVPAGTPMLLEEGKLIDGFIQGLLQMQKGGKYLLTIPAKLAYGDSPPPGSPIPKNADLTFEIELVDFMSREDAERRFMMLQQMMMQQQQQAGEAGQAPTAPPAQ